jgi:hypothetical protein
VDAKHCADLSVAHPLLEHGEDVSTKLGFIGIKQITFS